MRVDFGLVSIMFRLSNFILMMTTVQAVRNKVILVSMDGFRYDYLNKTQTPNFDRMTKEGVTMPYMNNTFPTNTFPSHYAMATGLYSESNGIIANDMYDPVFDSFFEKSNTESRWWDAGTPIWISANMSGLKSGAYFWPGSEAVIRGVQATEWFTYDVNIPFEDRVKKVIKWISQDNFDLALVYFHEPDASGHALGPEDPGMVPVIQRMDAVLGQLLQGLDNANLTDKVNLIVTSDHGMTTVDLQNKLIDLSSYVNGTLLHSLVDEGSTAQIRPQPGKDRELLAALSGIEHMQVMLKADIPERFHIKNNRRMTPLFAIADEGWYITDNATRVRLWNRKGDHGYDNNINSMKPIFVARGPAFKSNIMVEPVTSLDIYPLICHLLDINPTPNNGSLTRAMSLLREPVSPVTTPSSSAPGFIYCVQTVRLFVFIVVLNVYLR